MVAMVVVVVCVCVCACVCVCVCVCVWCVGLCGECVVCVGVCVCVRIRAFVSTDCVLQAWRGWCRATQEKQHLPNAPKSVG